jgi:predicted nucleic acid-binding protein
MVLDLLTGELEEVVVSSLVIDLAIRIRKSIRIKVPDAIIAATALERDAVLMTRNDADFKAVEGLTIVNPWSDG